MKKLLALILALCMIISVCAVLASCDHGNTDESTTETNAESTESGSTNSTTESQSSGSTEESTSDDNIPEAGSTLTVAQAIALGKSMDNGKYTEGKYYVKGTLKSVFNKNNGNIKIEDKDGNTLNVYGAMNADGTVKFADMEQAPAIGDVITVYGVVGQNNGSARIEGGFITEFHTPDASDSNQTDATETTDTGMGTGTETGTETETEETLTVPDSQIYNNGDEIPEAGIDWEVGSGFFANINHSIDASKAKTISAADLLAKMIDRDGENALKDGEVWIVTEALVLQSEKSYYGNGAAIIAEGGIVIKDAVDVVFKDVLVKGSITIENSAEIIFFKVFVDSDTTAVTLTNSSDAAFKTCRFRGKDAAITGDADCITIYSCYVYANSGIALKGDDNIIQNCKMFAADTAVSVSGNNCIVRENRIEVYAYGKGICVENAVNALVALNDIRGVQDSITVDKGFNCSVILNRAIRITGTANTNLYVVDNNVGGYMLLTDNNYIIAEGNNYPFDGLVHKTYASGNENSNGNNITDVNYRPEYGANEDILPHTNKELFVNMPRKSSVTDASFTSTKNLNSYVEDSAKKSNVVIVPPGAYSAYGALRVDETHSNTKIYAYGVYNEYSETNTGAYSRGQVVFAGAKNVSFYGLTLGYVLPSSGQVRIVEKYFTFADDDTKYFSEDQVPEEKKNKTRTYKLTIIPDAGFMDGFTTTDSSVFHTWWPEFFLSDENGEQKMYCEENLKRNHSVEKNYDENGEYDGTMTLTIDLPETATDDYREAKSAKGFFNRVSVGNVITCRFSFGGNGSYNINNCDNLTFKDTVIYGYAGVLSIVAGNNAGVTFERHHNAVHSENVIDKATYEKYVALEEKWNVDFEVREQILDDGTVIYRGPASRSGSIDAFHISGNREGVSVKSAILESMVDDGSNQKGSSSRMHDIVDNKDGTTTIYYKPVVSSVQWGNAYGQPNGTLGTMSCTNFLIGNKIYIYTPDGQTVCDSTVLSDAVKEGELTYDLKEGATHQVIKRNYYSVTVKTSDVNWDAIRDPATGNLYYDLSDNSHHATNRLIVDNISYNSCGYTMDNVIVLNGHSRGFLIKTRDVTVKHCTFRNVCNSGLRIMVEPEWCESSVPMNVLVQQCLFDNTSFHSQKYADESMAVILIDGDSSVVSEDTLPLNNITITGNKFTNSKQRYTIKVNSAKNVKITNNIFDANTFQIDYRHTGIAILLDVCMNVEISGNTYNYPHYDENNIRSVIVGFNYANIFGTDVTNEDGTPKLPDFLPEEE